MSEKQIKNKVNVLDGNMIPLQAIFTRSWQQVNAFFA